MWQSIQGWFKAKGGASHVVAGVWTFLVAAYAINPAFHAFATNIQKSMPGWLEDLVTLAVSLWSFYKTWRVSQPQQSPIPRPESMQ